MITPLIKKFRRGRSGSVHEVGTCKEIFELKGRNHRVVGDEVEGGVNGLALKEVNLVLVFMA